MAISKHGRSGLGKRQWRKRQDKRKYWARKHKAGNAIPYSIQDVLKNRYK